MTALNPRWEMQDCGYETACRVYMGRRNKKAGHGRIDVRSPRAHGETLIHRAEWVAVNGPIPKGMHLHHLCGMPPCARLDHLLLVTPLEHKRLHPKPLRTHCTNGHEFTPDNLIPSKAGYLICRICRREHDRRVWIPRAQRRAS